MRSARSTSTATLVDGVNSPCVASPVGDPIERASEFDGGGERCNRRATAIERVLDATPDGTRGAAPKAAAYLIGDAVPIAESTVSELCRAVVQGLLAQGYDVPMAEMFAYGFIEGYHCGRISADDRKLTYAAFRDYYIWADRPLPHGLTVERIMEGVASSRASIPWDEAGDARFDQMVEFVLQTGYRYALTAT